MRLLPIVIAFAMLTVLVPTTNAAANPDFVVVNASTFATYSTIQDALDAALDGDTITVPNGTWTESVTVARDGITLCATVANAVCATASEPGRFELNNMAFGQPPVAWQGQALQVTNVGSNSHFPRSAVLGGDFKLADIDALSYDFLLASGSCGDGSPRMQIQLDTTGDRVRDTAVQVYRLAGAPCPVGAWQHVDLMGARWNSGTYAQAVAAYPDAQVLAFNLIFDSGAATVWFDNERVNDVFLREASDLACQDPQDPRCETATSQAEVVLDSAGAPNTILITGADATVTGFTVRNTGTTGTHGVLVQGAGAEIAFNDLLGDEAQLLANLPRGFGIGLKGADASIHDNLITQWPHSGMYVYGAGGGVVADNVISLQPDNAIYVEDSGAALTLTANDLRSNRQANLRLDTDRVIVMRDNLMGLAENTITWTSGYAGGHVDARYQHWGAFTRDSIESTMVDSGDHTIDVSCYYEADGTTAVCPPAAAFTFSPTAPVWGQNTLFTDTSVVGGNDIASWAWTFGSAGTSAEQSPAFRFPQGGSYVVTLTTTDSEGFSSSASRTVVVSGEPVLNRIGAKSVDVFRNVVLRFVVSGQAGDANPLTFSASNLPAGAQFEPSNRTFWWYPTEAQVGTYTGVRFTVSNGTASDHEDVTIRVTANAGAVVSVAVVGDNTADAAPGEEVSFTYRVKNLGLAANTFALTPSVPAGWTVVASAAEVTLAKGAETLVTVTAVPDASALSGAVTLAADSLNGAHGVATATIVLPLTVEVVMDFETFFLESNVTGTVLVTWMDGSAAAGFDVDVVDEASVAGTPLPAGARSTTVTSAAAPVAFSFAPDPVNAPGEHVVTATAGNGSGSATYSIL